MNKYATVLICWMVYWYIGVLAIGGRSTLNLGH